MMMKKACLVLIFAMSPAALFAGETMVTRTTHTTTRTSTQCDFRVDKCQTSVATDTPYVRFKDGTPPLPAAGTNGGMGDPSYYQSTFRFVDYNFAPQPTIEELVALIRSKLSNCPEVTVNYDNDSGDITVHYLKSACGSDCDWVVNVRDVKTDDFVWTRTADNYSPYLGQMERRKFHCTSEKDAQAIASACAQICKANAWTQFQ